MSRGCVLRSQNVPQDPQAHAQLRRRSAAAADALLARAREVSGCTSTAVPIAVLKFSTSRGTVYTNMLNAAHRAVRYVWAKQIPGRCDAFCFKKR